MNRVVPAAVFVLLLVTTAATSRGDDWPQWRGADRDGVWHESGLIEKFPSDQLEVRWRQPIGSGYCGPTVANGRVYVTDRLVRPEQTERVLCFSEANGEVLWNHSYECKYVDIGYEAGPRASVLVDEGRAYSFGAMGHLFCLDAESGDVLWGKDLNQEYRILADNRMPIWGLAASPIMYQDLLIVHIGGQSASVVAFDKSNGEERWRSLRDRAQYSAPILVKQAGRDVLVCWTGDSVSGLSPESGEVYWRVPFTPKSMPIGVATPVVNGDRLFLTSFYDGSLMLRLLQDQPKVETIWRRQGRSERDTDALHSIISTPLIRGDHIYGVDSYGELRCLRADNGDRVWEDQTATPRSRWSTIHFVEQGERVWMFNERGELIIANLSPAGFEEISRAKLIEPTLEQLRQRGGVCWAHPAFANRHIYARNDKELICASLAAD